MGIIASKTEIPTPSVNICCIQFSEFRVVISRPIWLLIFDFFCPKILKFSSNFEGNLLQHSPRDKVHQMSSPYNFSESRKIVKDFRWRIIQHFVNKGLHESKARPEILLEIAYRTLGLSDWNDDGSWAKFTAKWTKKLSLALALPLKGASSLGLITMMTSGKHCLSCRWLETTLFKLPTRVFPLLAWNSSHTEVEHCPHFYCLQKALFIVDRPCLVQCSM